MSLEGRLYVVMCESIGDEFSSFTEIADKVRDSGPAEFKYHRLEVEHVMQSTSIVPYVSLLEYIGIIRLNNNQNYESILFNTPEREGAEELIVRKAVDRLEADGFNRPSYEKSVRAMLRQANVVLPSLREIYQALALKMSEVHFNQLCRLGGVRRHFGFTLVTRRVMLPTQGHQ